MFPALAAFVSAYGFAANPQTVAGYVVFPGGLMPSSGVDLISSQLEGLADHDREVLSFGFLIAIHTAFWSATNGVRMLFEALNLAYEEREKRSFIRLNLIAFAFTLGAIATVITMIVAIGVVPATDSARHPTDLYVKQYLERPDLPRHV